MFGEPYRYFGEDVEEKGQDGEEGSDSLPSKPKQINIKLVI